MEHSEANVESKWVFHGSSDEDARFDKSLQELKVLRSQLHYAATYCEDSYLKSEAGKKKTMDNTKEYICRALVTFVDHLGSVSANLEDNLLNTKQFEDTEARVNCLQQRLGLCQEYAQKLSLSKLQWTNKIRRHHTRYVSIQTQGPEKSTDVLRGINDLLVRKTTPTFKLDNNLEKEVPLFLYTFTDKPSVAQLPVDDMSSVAKLSRSISAGIRGPVALRVRDLSVMSIPRNPSFHFQETKSVGRNEKRRRSLQLPWRKSHGIHRGDAL